MPCTLPAPQPISPAAAAISAKFAWRITSRSPYSAFSASARRIASGSASSASTCPSGAVAASRLRVCPPPPKVPSIARIPGPSASICMTSSRNTGRCTGVVSIARSDNSGSITESSSSTHASSINVAAGSGGRSPHAADKRTIRNVRTSLPTSPTDYPHFPPTYPQPTAHFPMRQAAWHRTFSMNVQLL